MMQLMVKPNAIVKYRNGLKSYVNPQYHNCVILDYLSGGMVKIFLAGTGLIATVAMGDVEIIRIGGF